MALCVTEAGPKAPDTFIFNRGNPNVLGDKVELAFPTVLSRANAPQLDIKPIGQSSADAPHSQIGSRPRTIR